MENISVTISQPAFSVTQSAPCPLDKPWKIDFNVRGRYIYNLMSWVGSENTYSQLNLTFKTKEEAIEFAHRRDWRYEVIEPRVKKIVAKSYESNFC
jgi:hypothetical protein